MEPILEIELDGVSLKGTADSLRTLLEKMGHPIEHYFYNSSSKGWTLIKEMNEQHILNALVKHIKNKIDALKDMEVKDQIYYLNFIEKAGEPTSSGLAKELITRLSNFNNNNPLPDKSLESNKGKKVYSYWQEPVPS